MNNDRELPELPEPTWHINVADGPTPGPCNAFHERQMLAIRDAAYLAGLEAAAKICDERLRPNPIARDLYDVGYNNALLAAATAIRHLMPQPQHREGSP
jgi:hypothetical protein